MTDHERRITADDGVSLWMRDVGPAATEGTAAAGPAVLCLHGGPGVGDYLTPVEEALSDRFRVVRWDQRGAGRSDPVGPFTIDRCVADALAVADAAGGQHRGVSQGIDNLRPQHH